MNLVTSRQIHVNKSMNSIIILNKLKSTCTFIANLFGTNNSVFTLIIVYKIQIFTNGSYG